MADKWVAMMGHKLANQWIRCGPECWGGSQSAVCLAQAPHRTSRPRGEQQGPLAGGAEAGSRRHSCGWDGWAIDLRRVRAQLLVGGRAALESRRLATFDSHDEARMT